MSSPPINPTHKTPFFERFFSSKQSKKKSPSSSKELPRAIKTDSVAKQGMPQQIHPKKPTLPLTSQLHATSPIYHPTSPKSPARSFHPIVPPPTAKRPYSPQPRKMEKTETVIQTRPLAKEADAKEKVVTISFPADPIQFYYAFQDTTGLLPELIIIISTCVLFPTKFPCYRAIAIAPDQVSQKQQNFTRALERMAQSKNVQEEVKAIREAQCALGNGANCLVTREQLVQLATNKKQFSLEFLFGQEECARDPSKPLPWEWCSALDDVWNSIFFKKNTAHMPIFLSLLRTALKYLPQQDPGTLYITTRGNFLSLASWKKHICYSYENEMLTFFLRSIHLHKSKEIQDCFSIEKIIYYLNSSNIDQNLPGARYYTVKNEWGEETYAGYDQAIERLQQCIQSDSNKRVRTPVQFEADRQANITALRERQRNIGNPDFLPSVSLL